MLSSRRSSGSRVAGSTRRAPTISATAAPLPPSFVTLNALTAKMRSAVPSDAQTYNARGTAA